ncbi:hypothetical protein CEXT_475491 [Caerostris extrusa]|uniref:Secreted protein n=1 Tax=Caerostris extrusa TaxID=172846 RepID=A0AAV4XBF7_CAEEX|nr:hypothetical protein CEXT_475491 [Caerostris extrusa]
MSFPSLNRALKFMAVSFFIILGRTTKTKAPGNIRTKRPFLKALQESQRTELSPHCLYGKGRKGSIYRKWNSIHIPPLSSGGGGDFDPEKTSQALCRVIIFTGTQQKQRPPANIRTKRPFLKALQESQRTELSPHCLYGKRKERFHLPEMEFNSCPIFFWRRRTLILKRWQPPNILPTPHRKNLTLVVGKTLYPKCNPSSSRVETKSESIVCVCELA